MSRKSCILYSAIHNKELSRSFSKSFTKLIECKHLIMRFI